MGKQVAKWSRVPPLEELSGRGDDTRGSKPVTMKKSPEKNTTKWLKHGSN